MAHELKKKIFFEQKSAIYIRRCARLPIHSSQTQGKATQSVNFTYYVKNTDFFMGKMIVTASKRYFSIMVPQLDGGVFPTFVAKHQRT